MTSKRDKQIEAFIKQAEEIAREWTIAEIEGRDRHSEYTNKMYLVHELAKQVINAEDDKEAKE